MVRSSDRSDRPYSEEYFELFAFYGVTSSRLLKFAN